MSAEDALRPAARGRTRRVAVVGAGVAGLAAALELANRGVPVDLYAMAPARWSRSTACLSDLAAPLDLDGDGDDATTHVADTRRAGGAMASVPRIEAMVAAAPSWAERLARFGVPFDRTPAGRLAARRSPGAARARCLHAGAITGRLVLHALDEQVCRLERARVRDAQGADIAGEPLVRRREGWEFVDLVRDDAGRAVGVVFQDLRTMVVQVARHDGVVLATGGASGLFDASAASHLASGAAAVRAARRGATLADPDLFAWRPAIQGHGRLVHDALLAGGARLWIPEREDDLRTPREIPTRERMLLLDRPAPEAAHAETTAVSRALAKALRQGPRAVDATGAPARAAYLELPSRGELSDELAALVDGYHRRAGVDPALAPWLVVPGVECWLGGLWTDHGGGAPSPRDQSTSIPGLYAAGEAAAGPHGAGLLGGNALLACLVTGHDAACAVSAYREALPRSAYDLPAPPFDAAERDARAAYEALLDRGTEEGSHLALRDELASCMSELAGPVGDADGLDALDARLEDLVARALATRCTDTSAHLGRGAPLARRFDDQLWLARAVAVSARHRESTRSGGPAEAAAHTLLRAASDGGIEVVDG